MQRHGARMISTHWIKQIIGCDIPKYFNEIFLLNGEVRRIQDQKIHWILSYKDLY